MPNTSAAPINRSDLARVVDSFSGLKATHERHIADLDRMMADLAKQRETAVRDAYVAEVKQQAVRLAIRHMEDKGVI